MNEQPKYGSVEYYKEFLSKEPEEHLIHFFVGALGAILKRKDGTPKENLTRAKNMMQAYEEVSQMQRKARVATRRDMKDEHS